MLQRMLILIPLAVAVFLSWGHTSGSIDRQTLAIQINDALRRNRNAAADSLLRIGDSNGTLGAMELLQWSSVKEALGAPSASARLLCRAQELDHNLHRVAPSRLVSLLKDEPLDTVRAVLATFKSCSFGHATDTALVRKTLSFAYAQLGFPREQARAIIELETASAPIGKELMEISRRLLSHGDLRSSIEVGIAAYHRLPDESRQEMAFLLFQSYRDLTYLDSARHWIEKAAPLSAEHGQAAIVFYQWIGAVKKADSLIGLLPPSLERDTLLLRQMLFDAPRKAVAHIDRLCRERAWRERPDLCQLWTLRALLFSGKSAQASRVLDSLSHNEIMRAHPEIISFGLSGEVIGLTELWGQSEHAWYVGRPQDAVTIMTQAEVTGKARDYIVVRTCQSFLARSQPDNAWRLLEQFPETEPSPEYRLCKALVAVARGQLDRAQTILEQLMLEFPNSIQSSKARVTLQMIGTKDSGVPR